MYAIRSYYASLRERHWVWLQDNFPAIVARIPAQWRRYLPRMAEGFCSVDKADELRALFEKYGDLTAGYKRSLNQTEEKIGLCIALREQGRKFAGAASAPHAH